METKRATAIFEALSSDMQIAEALPRGGEMTDYVVSLSIEARK